MNIKFIVTIIFVTIIIILCARHELHKSIDESIQVPLPETEVVIEPTEKIKNKIYIANKNIDKKLENYTKHAIRRHIYSAFRDTMVNIGGKTKRLLYTNVPINLLFNITNTATVGISTINPLSSPASSSYVIYKHKDDNFDSFIDDGTVYILPT